MTKTCWFGIFLGVALSNGLHAAESMEFANKVAEVHKLRGQQAVQLKKLLTGTYGLTRNIGTEDLSQVRGTNNSWHMASRQSCIDKVIKTGLIQQNPESEKICGSPWMAPVAKRGEPASRAQYCIDQFEFPNIPCEYPVVWTPAAAAKQICEAMGKRVCNSHEWEGACSGSARSKDSYAFHISDRTARRAYVNQSRERTWAFQFLPTLARQRDTRGVCGVFSSDDPEIESPMRENLSQYFTANGKSKGCDNSGASTTYKTCGTNTWPSGFKYECRSEKEVFDLHGNLAEVVSLPSTPDQIANGKDQIGGTERKGSFFVYRPDYPDDCHVRQPYEHFGPYATDKMAYYQEGFRCCKDVSEGD